MGPHLRVDQAHHTEQALAVDHSLAAGDPVAAEFDAIAGAT
jgi:hypothetical protein